PEDGIRDSSVTGVQTCALPISRPAHRDGKIASDQLTHALRHVRADALAAVFARAPGLWGDALECFASAPLARVLFVSIEDIPPRSGERRVGGGARARWRRRQGA